MTNSFWLVAVLRLLKEIFSIRSESATGLHEELSQCFMQRRKYCVSQTRETTITSSLLFFAFLVSFLCNPFIIILRHKLYLNTSIFWDITPCSPLKVNRRFVGTCRKQISGCHLISRFLSQLILLPWRWRRHIPPKLRLTFTVLHGIISQRIEHFITTGVKTYTVILFADDCRWIVFSIGASQENDLLKHMLESLNWTHLFPTHPN
jgi:hypothetical protein